MEAGDRRPIEEWGHDAQWADELHHALHVLLTGERDGLLRALRQGRRPCTELDAPDAAERLVVCAQNHDQVGNRALGDRLPRERLRLAACCSLFAPGVPLLFMGEEHGETPPFQFFTDHNDPEIAQATREGRRREFARFAAFAGEDVPDPQASRPSSARSSTGPMATRSIARFYRELLALRRRTRLPRRGGDRVDEAHRVLRVQRGPASSSMNFSAIHSKKSVHGRSCTRCRRSGRASRFRSAPT